MNYQRMITFIAMLALIAGSLGLSACSNSAEDRKLRGQVVGGVTGAAVGSLFGKGRVLAVGAGAVLGTVIGGKAAE